MDEPTTPAPDFGRERELLQLSECAYRVIAAARALVESNRPVDLTGIQEQVGLICARALDLPAEQAGFAKLALNRLVTGLDLLDLAMRKNSA